MREVGVYAIKCTTLNITNSFTKTSKETKDERKEFYERTPWV